MIIAKDIPKTAAYLKSLSDILKEKGIEIEQIKFVQESEKEGTQKKFYSTTLIIYSDDLQPDAEIENKLP
jgi:hypothetical protein